MRRSMSGAELDLALGVELERRVDAADVLAADQVTPLMAAPTAKCSQFLRAISVEPSAPVKTGTSILTLWSQPYSVSVFTSGKVQVSGLASTPSGRPSPPRA